MQLYAALHEQVLTNNGALLHRDDKKDVTYEESLNLRLR